MDPVNKVELFHFSNYIQICFLSKVPAQILKFLLPQLQSHGPHDQSKWEVPVVAAGQQRGNHVHQR